MRILFPGALFVSAILASGATLADGMKPGQWEVARSGSVLANLHAGMERMPPEARKAMEEAIKSQNAAFAGDSGKLVNRVCVTAEQAAEYRFAGNDPKQSSCKWQKPEREGQTVRVGAQCPGARVEGVLNFSSDTGFTGSWTSWLKDAPGPMKEDLVGKWLGAKCGS